MSADSSNLSRALTFAWLVALMLFFVVLPHDGASAAPGALEVSGNRITYDGSPVRLRGVATEEVYDLYYSDFALAQQCLAVSLPTSLLIV